MGVFGGIVMGVVAALLYNKFHAIELPSYLGFFQGKRFVPIITALTSILVGAVMCVIWPPLGKAINYFSLHMVDADPTLAAFVFGVVERALVPFGLHHIWYNPFWYMFGSYTTKAGQVVHGDNLIFFAQMKDGVPFTAGTFMTGKFPFMMFGLPAAALAIYHEAKPEKKPIIAGIMASAALTSFLTGITEPIEFSFLFVAPVLYGIHCIFAGLSFAIMQLLNVKIGMTFSGGLIDFVLFGVLQNRTAWWLVIPVGLCFSAIYYFGFRFAIRTFDLKTPGREDDDLEFQNFKGAELAYGVLKALGGNENIAALDACITRLRVSVKNIGNIDEHKLKSLGASGVMVIGNSLQAIFGPKSDNLKTQMRDIMAGKKPTIIKYKEDSLSSNKESGNAGIVAPMDGRLISITDVPDIVFSKKLMGDGFAIEPHNGEIVSPIDGLVTTVFPTKHAVAITGDNGLEVLIHFGIDTVKLKGEGLTVLVTKDSKVKKGQPILKADIDAIKDKVPSLITPIIFTNLSEGRSVSIKAGKKIKRGQKNIIEII
jgi:PTS system D-glucosamine-specific IIC component